MDFSKVNDTNLKELLIEMQSEIESLKRPYTIHFAKVREQAIIPTRRQEDAGYDLYACFDADMMIIPPHKTVLIPTGIATSFDHTLVFKLSERGSTGTKPMAQRSGVIDSGFRGEIKAPISNLNDVPIVISKMVYENGETYANDDLPDVMSILTKKGKIDKITKEGYEELLEDAIVYPYTKAITQGIVYYIPETVSDEISYDKLKEIPSERGLGMLGASGK